METLAACNKYFSMQFSLLIKQFYSHIGRRCIAVPQAVSISLENVKEFEVPRFNRTPKQHFIVVKGPKGELKFPLHYGLQLDLGKGKANDEASLVLSMSDKIAESLGKHQRKFLKSMWGTTQAILRNSVDGVFQGHQLPIRVVGVGYKFLLEGGQLIMKVGHSHLDKVDIPKGITVKLSNPTKIVCTSADLHQLTQFAAKVRAVREPEPYNGKGIFVGDETIMLKEGKKSGK